MTEDVGARSLRPASGRYQDIPEHLRPSWAVMISFLIDDVARLQRAALDQRLKPLGASRAHWSLMSEVAQTPGLKQIELAQRLGLSRVAVTQLVERLADRGLLDVGVDPADRRLKRISLSAQGGAVLDEVRAVGFDFLTTLTSRIAPGAREVLVQELEGIKARLLIDDPERPSA